MSNPKLSYDDITLVPEVVSDICSRSQCNPYDERQYLPIFAAPMSSVVSFENIKNFNDARIRVVVPRSYPLEERLNLLEGTDTGSNFVAFSLNEAKECFCERMRIPPSMLVKGFPIKICIDLANGHMKCLLELVKSIKSLYGSKIQIMTGNIANPETYRLYEEAGVDYVRVSIGTGNVCSTSSNTAIHYPVFSLLEEVYKVKKEIDGKCKIIADGGIHGFRDIQKALIYADYVMIGSLFNKAIESAGKTTYGTFYWNVRGKKIARPIKTLLYYGKEVPKEKYDKVFKLIKENKLTVWKENFGMSTKIAQGLINDANGIETKKLKTSEGLLKHQKVEYTLMGWAENETDYLKSAMSYTNSRTLDEYKDSQWVQILKIAYNQ
jgi:hypothetical protein